MLAQRKCRAVVAGLGVALGIASALAVPVDAFAASAITSGTIISASVEPTSNVMLMSASDDAVDNPETGGDAVPNAMNVATVTHDGVATEFTSVDDAIAALQDGDTLKMSANATVKSNTAIAANDVTIDLDGNELKIVVNDAAPAAAIGLDFTGANARIANGSVVDMRTSNTKSCGYIAVRVSGSDASLTVDNIEIKSYQSNSTANYNYILRADDNSSLHVTNGSEVVELAGLDDEGDKLVFGENTYGCAGIVYYGTVDNATVMSPDFDFNYDDETSVTIDGGSSVDVGAFAIAGNGASHGTNLTISDATIHSDFTQGIYHPQDGELVVNDGAVIEGLCGIEVRAGHVTINGGKISGGNGKLEQAPNGNGTTSSNVGIAIAQHTTKLPISVTINDGTLSGTNSLNQSNVEGNSADDVKKIDIEVNGGTFETPIASENFSTATDTGFVNGGEFADVSVYDVIADGMTIYVTSDTETFVVGTPDENFDKGGIYEVVDPNGVSWLFDDEKAAQQFVDEVEAESGGSVKLEVTDNAFDVTFDDGIDGNSDSIMHVNKGDGIIDINKLPQAPTRDGYEFGGWYLDAGCTKPFDTSVAVTGDMTVYAKWTPVDEQNPTTDTDGSSDEVVDTGNETTENENVPVDAVDDTGDAQQDGDIFDADTETDDLVSTGVAVPYLAVGIGSLIAAIGAFILRKLGK